MKLSWLLRTASVYLVKGESDAPAAEEQRAPANGWCDLLKIVSYMFWKFCCAWRWLLKVEYGICTKGREDGEELTS